MLARISRTLLHPKQRIVAFSTSNMDELFQQKIAQGKSLPPLEDNSSKLEMYALYKQATVGENTTTKPGMLDFVGKAKWEAWSRLGDMSQEEAKKKYIAIIDDLVEKAGQSEDKSGQQDYSASTSEDIIIEQSKEGLLTLKLNRPKRYNALNREMYASILDALNTSKDDNSVKAVAIRASGAMFTSGNDLSMFTPIEGESFEQTAKNGSLLLQRFINSFLDYPKPIVACVQGPSIGIGVTMLALCDLVYVSDKVTLHTPFTSLGQCPEACSSVLFPQIMGTARANAMLLLGEKISGQEAKDVGLATDMFPQANFDKSVDEKLDLLLSRYPNAMKESKALIRPPALVEELKATGKKEAEKLEKLWLSAECMDAMTKFQSRKK